METPITPPPYQPIPAPVTPSVSVMPPAKPASSMRWLWIALVAVVVFAGAAYGWMTLYPSSSDQQATPSPSSTASPVVNAPGVETFTSQALGIRFDYLTDQGSPVIEEGDTVYVGGKGGQWVRVFTKAPGDNLQTAITKRFLAGVPAGKCIVSITAEDKNPDILFGNINVDFEPTDPGDPRLASSPCPAEYRVTNGIRYFYMDTAHPDRFFFFSIGQYAIPAEPIGTKDGKTWQDTFEVTDLK